jgi:hypothetical protein
MYLTPFVSVFGELGGKETRVLTVRGYTALPNDEYALLEAYCMDPACDCRRVMLNVVGRHQGASPLASVSFGFERDSEMAGPFLDPINPQSQYADVLFPLVVQILADQAYVSRLESHYRQVKRAAADPHDPSYETIQRLRRDGQRREVSMGRSAGRARTKRRKTKR